MMRVVIYFLRKVVVEGGNWDRELLSELTEMVGLCDGGRKTA